MGFLQRLFGIKEEENTIQAKQPKEAYFLDADSAKTFGDIDYMRQPKAVERTFPKVEGMNYGGRRKIGQFTSMDAATVYDGDGKPGNAPAPSTASFSTPAPAAPPAPAASEAPAASSTPADTSTAPTTPATPAAPVSDDTLDFRSMARSLKR